MEKIVLQAEPRGTGRHQVRELRNAARVPAVVYGQGIAPQPIALEAKGLSRALHTAGTGLLTLEIPDQEPRQVLTREVQRHPTKHNVLHVDFHAVSMTEELRVHVPVVHEGQSPAMTNPDVVLVRQLDEVEVECLPGDIPSHLVADLARLKTVDDELIVSDLIIPPGVKLLTDGDYVIFSLTFSRAAAEEEEEAVEEADADAVEVVAKGKAAKEGAEEEEREREKR
jgi:large subunit ribosomal protein L25